MKRALPFNLSLMICLVCLMLSPLWMGFAAADNAPADEAELTFTDLGMAESRVLSGPVPEFTLTFNLPAGWSPSGTARLDLAYSAFFSSILPQENEQPVSGLIGGNLGVWVNGKPVGLDTLQMSGDSSLPLRFDAALLTTPEQGGINEIRVRWDGSSSCRMNLLSSITILPDSTLAFAYSTGAAAFTLNSFPAPFLIKGTIRPEVLTLVLPSAPTAAELHASMVTAAGLGRLSGGQSDLALAALETFEPAADSPQSVVIVAGGNRLVGAELKALGLAAAPEMAAGEGLIHLFTLTGGGYALLVSGDDEGLIKAAQTVSLGRLVPSGGTGTMHVSKVNPLEPTELLEDMTLRDLGAEEIILSNDSGLERSVEFNVPEGKQPRPDSTFELTISHSQQLDYLNSGLRVDLNGSPVVSLRLNDNTSNQSVFRVIVPANLVHPGRNTLGFTATLNMRDICVQPDEAVAWLRISADSLLHLPLEPGVIGGPVARTFGDFPAAFQAGYSLEDVTLLVSPGSFESVQAAGLIAFKLGAGLPDARPIALAAFTAGAENAAQPYGRSLIMVGKPLDFNGLASRDTFPSLTVNTDNTLSPGSGVEVVNRPAAGEDVGYLAIRGQRDLSTLAILGSSPAGITSAVAALDTPVLKENNFAILTGDGSPAGWYDPSIAGGGSVKPTVEGTPVPEQASIPRPYRQMVMLWVVPLMILLAASVVLLVVMEVRGRE